MSMSTFAERQAALIAQVLGGFTMEPESCLHFDQRFGPRDLPLTHQEQQQFDNNCRGMSPNSAPISAYDVTDGMWSQCELTEPPGFEPLPEPPVKRPRNGSFYTLEDILKKLPRGAPTLGLRTASRQNIEPLDIPLSPINVPPSPQFSSDLSLSSPLPFSVGFSCWPASSPDVEKQHHLPTLQNYHKPPYASVEPAEHRGLVTGEPKSVKKFAPWRN
ncbi:hypothetical protein KI387_043120 [Taxus chinensis]|uniref:Uncharacterized protein n=1 Tax=Taxus chinensis TaxID=29808 RepID=A0AA38BYZ6_TAXCH|nr:hypothetical protein KI387_043120 [Taxus chinensis]